MDYEFEQERRTAEQVPDLPTKSLMAIGSGGVVPGLALVIVGERERARPYLAAAALLLIALFGWADSDRQALAILAIWGVLAMSSVISAGRIAVARHVAGYRNVG